MNENLWGEEDPFSDMPDEAQTGGDGKAKLAQPQQAPTPLTSAQQELAQRKLEHARARVAAVEQAEPELEEVEEVEPQEEDFEDVLSDAHLRLEQGSLYKLIMNHDLFAGVEADPRAIQNVQKEIKKFARESMEVMLGMRHTVGMPYNPEQPMVSSPFNDLEVEVLKRLASKATNGATETEEANQVATSFKQTPKRNVINPIGGAVKKPTPAPLQAPKVAKKPLPAKAAAPIVRQKTKQELLIEQIAREEGVPIEALELNVHGVGGKPIQQMSAAELEERNRLAAQRRGTQVKSATAVPMATYEEQLSRAQSQFSAVVGNSGQMQKLIDTVKAMPVKNP